MKTREEILKEAKVAREAACLNYQINIDNFKLAIAEVDKDNDQRLKPFKDNLKNLLEGHELELKKELIMLRVISRQLET